MARRTADTGHSESASGSCRNRRCASLSIPCDFSSVFSAAGRAMPAANAERRITSSRRHVVSSSEYSLSGLGFNYGLGKKIRWAPARIANFLHREICSCRACGNFATIAPGNPNPLGVSAKRVRTAQRVRSHLRRFERFIETARALGCEACRPQGHSASGKLAWSTSHVDVPHWQNIPCSALTGL
jgi:hypothetical protein